MIGTALNQYQVTARLGAGGMGEVFRARDTRLNREVAIKMLPKEFASDPDRLRRFEQESKTLAALNHPNILTIHDAGVQDGAPYLVSELLEGRTLREEFSSGALPVRKATDYALQIAHGLAAAHSRGIIHRDLKPENLFVTKDGRIKILDFGLAKLRSDFKCEIPNFKSQANPNAPTLAESTTPGMVLGTPAYMSPEQVRGEPADHRSDIFAFGCVLYEMLSGQRAFRRDTPIESMNAVLRDEPPDLRAGNSKLPAALDRVVGHCLEKDPQHRFQSAQDLGFALELATGDSILGAPSRETAKTPSRARWIGSRALVPLLLFGAGILAHKLWSPTRVAAAPSIRPLTLSGHDYSPAVSPDGKRVCFRSDRDGTNRIWIKEIASGSEAPLTTGPDESPRFSRDGSAVLFTRVLGPHRALFRVPSIGGEPSKIIGDARAGDWSPDGRQITFTRWGEDGSSSIYTIGSDGSAETLLHRFADNRCSPPRWSPDGAKIAVALNQSGHPQSLVWIEIATRQVHTVPAPNPYNLLSDVAWDTDSHSFLYLQAESVQADISGSPAELFRQRIDSGQFRQLLWCPALCAVLDLLPSGDVVMDAESCPQNLREYALFSSNSMLRSLTLGGGTDRQPAYSPDGQDIVFSSNQSGNLEIWSVSRTSGIRRRLTDNPADDWDPAFSPDGQHLLWSSTRTGNLEIWIANADGSSPRQVTRDRVAAQNPTMTRDNRWIVYASYNPRRPGIWKIHPDGSGDTALVPSATVGNAEVSPEGRYAAYRDYSHPGFVAIKVVEIESGSIVPFEVRVPLYGEYTAKSGRVRWMPDGRTLVYVGEKRAGVFSLFRQDFIPGQDTSNSRHPLDGFDREDSVESFCISPDGRFLTIATWEQSFSLVRTVDLHLW